MAADKGNLIDITKRLKKKREEAKKTAGTQAPKTNVSVRQLPAEATNVLDMTARRREMIQAERRNVRRTVIAALARRKRQLTLQVHLIVQDSADFNDSNTRLPTSTLCPCRIWPYRDHICASRSFQCSCLRWGGRFDAAA